MLFKSVPEVFGYALTLSKRTCRQILIETLVTIREKETILLPPFGGELKNLIVADEADEIDEIVRERRA